MPCQQVKSQAIESLRLSARLPWKAEVPRTSTSHEATEGSTKLRGLVMECSRACAANCATSTPPSPTPSPCHPSPHEDRRRHDHRDRQIHHRDEASGRGGADVAAGQQRQAEGGEGVVVDEVGPRRRRPAMPADVRSIFPSATAAARIAPRLSFRTSAIADSKPATIWRWNSMTGSRPP